MAGNPAVLALLEEMLDSGRTPEQVCCDCPELLSANHTVRGDLATVLSQLGRHDEAEIEIRRLVALSPTPNNAQQWLRVHQIRQGRVEEVLRTD